MLMLADHAVVAEGKLYIAGGGWSVRAPHPTASAIAVKLDVPWNMTNEKITFQLALVHEDGQPVTQTGLPDGEPIVAQGELEVGRPPGITPGTPIDVPLAVSIPPLPLPPGGRFSWDLTVNGATKDEWHLPFTVRAL